MGLVECLGPTVRVAKRKNHHALYAKCRGSAFVEITTTGNIINSPLTAVGPGGVASTITTATVAAVRSHEGYYLVGAGTTSGTSFVRSYGAGGSITQSYTTSAFAAPTDAYFSMSNIVAPELGSFAVLGLGIVPLVLRRRRPVK